jgi:hypothetical protein
MLRRGVHSNNTLQNIYNKYGQNNLWFGVLEIVKDEKELISVEQNWIDKFWFSDCLINESNKANKPPSCKGKTWKQKHPAIGMKNSRAKLNDYQVMTIRDLYKLKYLSQQKLADFFDIGRRTLRDIINGNIWSWLK